MEKEILVSVLCAAYNHENYIRAAIEGFLMQKTAFAFEVIVHDDASTDKTQAIITEYAKKYPELIIPVFQTENQYKRGVKIYQSFLYPITRGKYISLCEGDDFWIDENKLQKQVEFMSSHPECSMCYHSAKVYNVKTQKYESTMRPFHKTRILPENILFYGGGHEVPTASIMFLKEHISNIPGFALESPVGDHPLALLLSYRGRIGYIDETMSVRNLWVPDSWNTRYYDGENISRHIDHIKAMQRLLKAYDIYTGNKFGRQIDKRIIAGEMEICRAQNEDPYKSGRFLEMLESFNRMERIKIWISCKMPEIAKLYSSLKSKIKSII